MPAKEGDNRPPIIVKKVTVVEAGHHGGAWKVAYADFVTAMMAFFLLLWLLGATTEDQRQGLADYFTPTLVKIKDSGAGANGLLAGASLDRHQPFGQVERAAPLPRDEGGDAVHLRIVMQVDDRDRRVVFEMIGGKRGVHAASCQSAATAARAMASTRPQAKSPSRRSSLPSIAERLV